MRTINNPDNFRSGLRNRLHKKIENIFEKEVKLSIATNLEKGIYNITLENATKNKIVKKWDNSIFVTLYIIKYRSIFNNITKPLIEKIINKSIKPHMIANMTHQELQPEKRKDLLKAKKIKDENR